MTRRPSIERTVESMADTSICVFDADSNKYEMTIMAYLARLGAGFCDPNLAIYKAFIQEIGSGSMRSQVGECCSG